MLTLEKFEEASEKVKEVVLPTNLIYSEYFQSRREIRFILNLKICSTPELTK
jgi:threonine dehydratase